MNVFFLFIQNTFLKWLFFKFRIWKFKLWKLNCKISSYLFDRRKSHTALEWQGAVNYHFQFSNLIWIYIYIYLRLYVYMHTNANTYLNEILNKIMIKMLIRINILHLIYNSCLVETMVPLIKQKYLLIQYIAKSIGTPSSPTPMNCTYSTWTKLLGHPLH